MSNTISELMEKEIIQCISSMYSQKSDPESRKEVFKEVSIQFHPDKRSLIKKDPSILKNIGIDNFDVDNDKLLEALCNLVFRVVSEIYENPLKFQQNYSYQNDVHQNDVPQNDVPQRTTNTQKYNSVPAVDPFASFSEHHKHKLGVIFKDSFYGFAWRCECGTVNAVSGSMTECLFCGELRKCDDADDDDNDDSYDDSYDDEYLSKDFRIYLLKYKFFTKKTYIDARICAPEKLLNIYNSEYNNFIEFLEEEFDEDTIEEKFIECRSEEQQSTFTVNNNVEVVGGAKTDWWD